MEDSCYYVHVVVCSLRPLFGKGYTGAGVTHWSDITPIRRPLPYVIYRFKRPDLSLLSPEWIQTRITSVVG